jgi:hypothetical protein
MDARGGVSNLRRGFCPAGNLSLRTINPERRGAGDPIAGWPAAVAEAVIREAIRMWQSGKGARDRCIRPFPKEMICV